MSGSEFYERAGRGEGCAAKTLLDHILEPTQPSKWQVEVFSEFAQAESSYNGSKHGGNYPTAKVELKVNNTVIEGRSATAIEAYLSPQPEKVFKDPLTGKFGPLRSSLFYEIRDSISGEIVSTLDPLSSKMEKQQLCSDLTKMRLDP